MGLKICHALISCLLMSFTIYYLCINISGLKILLVGVPLWVRRKASKAPAPNVHEKTPVSMLLYMVNHIYIYMYVLFIYVLFFVYTHISMYIYIYTYTCYIHILELPSRIWQKGPLTQAGIARRRHGTLQETGSQAAKVVGDIPHFFECVISSRLSKTLVWEGGS